MKKIISIVLLLALCLSLCACGAMSDSGTKFVGTYEDKGQISVTYSGWGYNNLVDTVSYKETLKLESDGGGSYEQVATTKGKYHEIGDVIAEGTVTWETDGEYVTVTIRGTSYKRDNGNNVEVPIDRTVTYEMKGSTLHSASNGSLAYTKIG